MCCAHYTFTTMFASENLKLQDGVDGNLQMSIRVLQLSKSEMNYNYINSQF